MSWLIACDVCSNPGAPRGVRRQAGSWSSSGQVFGSDVLAGDFFGNSIAIDGDTAVITAPLDDTPPMFQHGSVYFFQRITTPADITGDGVVDGVDLGILLANWSIPPGTAGCGGAPGGCDADLNGDGTVDGLDLGILLTQWTM